MKNNPIEGSFIIGPLYYEIINQSSRGYSLAVRVSDRDTGTSNWLKIPESRYETLGGARLAILKHLESKIIHIKGEYT